jgi:hypothetical protein
MSENRTAARCRRTECMFYEDKPDDVEYIWCLHPDKPHYLKAHPCPLFRLDIKRQTAASGENQPKDFLKMIRKR